MKSIQGESEGGHFFLAFPPAAISHNVWRQHATVLQTYNLIPVRKTVEQYSINSVRRVAAC